MVATHLPLDVVPDEDDPSCATVWVTIHVGDDRIPFLLDTGARRSQVRADLASDWPVLNEDTCHTVFSEHHSLHVTAPPLLLGELRIEDLEVSRAPDDAAGVHNLLGLDVLRHHSCLLNLAEKTLTLDGRTDTTGAMMPLYLDDVGHAYLDLVIESKTASAVWDTGAGITVVDTSLIARHPRIFDEIDPTSGTDGAGRTKQTPTYIMGPISIAGVSFEAQKVAAVDLSAANATLDRPMDLILG